MAGEMVEVPEWSELRNLMMEALQTSLGGPEPTPSILTERGRKEIANICATVVYPISDPQTKTAPAEASAGS